MRKTPSHAIQISAETRIDKAGTAMFEVDKATAPSKGSIELMLKKSNNPVSYQYHTGIRVVRPRDP